jgi:type IX secretion system PorP/SprF family membrane protein
MMILCLLACTYRSDAQQLPMYTQYMNSGFLFNPAMAGHDGYTAVNLTARKQWVGFSNAPVTYSVAAQTRLYKQGFRIKSTNRGNRLRGSTKGRVGLGAYVFSDQNGLVSRTGTQLTYAYHIYLKESQLSFGLGGQIFQYKIDRDRITTKDADPTINTNGQFVTFIADANFGVFWSHPNFFAGIAANQLLQSNLKFGEESLEGLKLFRHYYIMGGYRLINRRSGFDLEPSFLLKTTEQFIPQGDIGVKLYYREDYWIGLSYRTDGALAGMFGVRTEKFYLGYAYDYALSSIRKYNFGSHEVFISVKFGSNERRFRWLNRY